jgi:FixJ family two-component response regulator
MTRLPTVYRTVPTVYVVEDDAAARRSTEGLLGAAGLASRTFESAEAFLADVPPDSPGCLILDHALPGMTGLDLLPRLRERAYALPVLMVSGAGTVQMAVEGMKLGLYDFLVKPADPDELLSRVRAALELDARRRAAAARLDEIRARLATLTAREQELLELIVWGLPNKNIARELGISIKTVQHHRMSLMSKTGAANVADLVRMRMLASAAAVPPNDPTASRPTRGGAEPTHSAAPGPPAPLPDHDG